MRLYAISYDDTGVLREFAEKQSIPYPLLSDVDSAVIRRFGVQNTLIGTDDAFLYGIPFPGAFVTDEDGRVIAKFFPNTYKKRDSPETFLDAALGRVELSDDTPRATGGEPSVRITAAVHGGKGTLRQGVLRKIVVRFELDPGLHLYGEPVPQGMTPTRVRIEAPPGFVTEPPILPPTEPLEIASSGVELEVFSQSFDIQVPFYADARLASEVRPLDMEFANVSVCVDYQACDDHNCLLARTERLELAIPLDVIDVPALSLHRGHGQREGNYNGTPHMRRLFFRKLKEHPLGLLRFLAKNARLEWAARKRKQKT